MAEQKDLTGLDNIPSFNLIDKSGMLALVDKIPEMMEEGWAISEKTRLTANGKFDNIVISGMGGSAISGDIVSLVLREKSTVPLFVNRNYTCPKFVGSGTLFIALSYSGNTEETISSFKDAVGKGARIVSISSGGDIKALSEKYNIPLIEIPGGLPPRAAIGYLLSATLNVIFQMGLDSCIKDDFEATTKLLKQLSKKYSSRASVRDNEVKLLAQKLVGRVPVVMASEGTTSAAALRWKTQLNENSKATALVGIFPELDHNDIVNFSFLKQAAHNYSFVALRDEGDIERMKKRIEITKSLISGHVGGILEVWSKGESRLERLMSLILFGDYLSVYLAILDGVDPTPVDIIEKLKKELAR